MERRVLITVAKDEIAPRFDLTTEALLLNISESGEIVLRKSFLLAHASGDELCDLALSRARDYKWEKVIVKVKALNVQFNAFLFKCWFIVFSFEAIFEFLN